MIGYRRAIGVGVEGVPVSGNIYGLRNVRTGFCLCGLVVSLGRVFLT